MWKNIDVGRWIAEHSDDSTAYLLAAGQRILELHVETAAATLHEYRGQASDANSPLADAAHQQTTGRPDLAGADASRVWSALAQEV